MNHDIEIMDMSTFLNLAYADEILLAELAAFIDGDYHLLFDWYNQLQKQLKSKGNVIVFILKALRVHVEVVRIDCRDKVVEIGFISMLKYTRLKYVEIVENY